MKVLIDIDEALYNYILDGTLNEVNHAVKNGLVLDNATNGEVIKALFPNAEYWISLTLMWMDGEYLQSFDLDWWNAPYKESEDKE